MSDAVMKRWGQVDIPSTTPAATAAPAEDYPDDGWRKVMNLMST
jgi:hypothetical protein